MQDGIAGLAWASISQSPDKTTLFDTLASQVFIYKGNDSLFVHLAIGGGGSQMWDKIIEKFGFITVAQ